MKKASVWLPTASLTKMRRLSTNLRMLPALAFLSSVLFILHMYSIVSLSLQGASVVPVQNWTPHMLDEFVGQPRELHRGDKARKEKVALRKYYRKFNRASKGKSDLDARDYGDFFVEPDEPLNIVVLYPDDWRYDTIENPIVHTPFLSRVASSLGMQFARNFVTTSICWISRATLFTGEYASRHKSLLIRKPVPFYSRWNDTWVGRLRAAGYYVGLSGKWQFEDEEQRFVNSAFDWVMLSGGHWGLWNRTRMHMTEVHANEAVEFLRTRPQNRNFALTVAFYPPKAEGSSREPGVQWSPLPKIRHLYDNVTIPPPRDVDGVGRLATPAGEYSSIGRGRWRERFEGDERYQASIKNYYALVTQIDEAMRRIVEELEHQNVLNKTLVIITADNGMFLGDHGLAGKWYPYEESIRVPLLVLDPRLPPEKRGKIDYESFTLNVDLASTIMAAANVRPYPTAQGRDFSELYRRSAREKLQVEPWRTDFLYEFPSVSGIDPSSALVTHEYKYVEWPRHNKPPLTQLFDRRVDEYEQNNLLGTGNLTEADIRKIAAELKTRHDKYMAAIV